MVRLSDIMSGKKLYKPTGTEFSAADLAIKDFVENQGVKKGLEAHSFGVGDVKGGMDLFSCTRTELIDTVRKVMAQYGMRVGMFYGMKQAMLWLNLAAVNTQHKAGVDDQSLLAAAKALAVCGSLYEDLGLAGYNPKAEAFTDCLEFAIKPSGVIRFRPTEKDILKRLRGFNSIEAMAELKKEGLIDELDTDTLHVHERGMVVMLRECAGLLVDERCARQVIRSRQINVCFGDLEKGKTKPRYGEVGFIGRELKELAAIVGMMRRASKGKLASDANIDAIIGYILDEDSSDEVRKPLAAQTSDDAIKFFFGKSKPVTGLVFRAKNMVLGAVNAKANDITRQEEYWESQE